MPSHTNSMPTGSLTGIRVIVLGQIAAGRFARPHFADLGVHVVKIQRPDSIGSMRQYPRLTGDSAGALIGGT